ncbi:MAG: ferritin-like domain-containing protein [Methylotenera sp.]|nr:ferritin-like domain-containing protein [Methylotenera sp.]
MLTRNIECRKAALDWLCESDASIKAAGVLALGRMVTDKNPHLIIDTKIALTPDAIIPGRPLRPKLVNPLELPKRSMRTIDGRAALIHALAHIEFNAINLALDAIWRFADMPENYYYDWLKVAAEEAYHFSLLNAHLHTLGFEYGSFAGHNSLWEMVDRTKNDVLARMALVPRTMEARGLDASPQLHNKFVQIGDLEMGEILTIILRDEIGHVAIGNIWFNWLCKQRNLKPINTFEVLKIQYDAPKLRPPFNMEARRQAGFSEAELALLN